MRVSRDPRLCPAGPICDKSHCDVKYPSLACEYRGRRFTALLIAVLVVTATLRPATAAVDQREMKAREAFAMGQYQDALDLFAKLYAEKLHPNYLRNIGRCYQNLGEPDKAINSFREYLRKAKTVASDERQEVEGYIKEMEDLKAKQQATTTTPPNPATGTGTTTTTSTTSATTDTTPSATTSTGAVPALDPTTTAATTTTTAAGADLTGGPQPASGEDGAGPIYGRWWFWAIVAGVAAAGIGVAAAAGAFTTTQNAKCPAGTTC